MPEQIESPAVVDDRQDWQKHRKNVYSQNGEDGILEELFRRIGTTNKWCFEVGAADGVWFSNTRNLIAEGWNAVLVEADAERFAKLKKLASAPDSLIGIGHVITLNESIEPTGPHSLDAILERQHNFPAAPDFGVIDVDGDDYYVFLNLLHHLPRVLMVEFDVTAADDFVPERGSGKQAGRRAVASVGASKGYTLLAAMGPNLIFVLNELVGKVTGETTVATAPPNRFNVDSGYVDSLEPINLSECKVRLNLGAGDLPLPGYLNIDRKYHANHAPLDGKRRGDVFPLTSFMDGEADEIRASHVLEHFSGRQAPDVLREWVRVLKPGGVLKIAVPDFDKIIEAVNAGNPNGWPIQGYIYGGQVDDDDYHKAGYNETYLRHLMAQAGLVDIEPWQSDIRDCAALPISLNLQGRKPSEPPAISRPFPSHRRMAAVMSMPRLAFAQNMFSALQAFVPLQIPFEKVEGAWWCQCMERVLTPKLVDGTEYVFTLDYDTAFRPEHVHQLAVLMEERPEADAIVPVQFKRADALHLFRPIDPATGAYRTGAMTLDEFEEPLVPIGWGHFGLTIFRVSALKKMAHPWFQARPAADGTWGEGRTDADIAFWEKFRATGNKIFLATHVAVGHLELMASLPDQNLQRFHSHAEDLGREWPKNARR